mgnify:CR=1 FL=1
MTKIVIFSGARADIGLLSPLILKLKKKCKVYLVNCNMHMNKIFGDTSFEIKKLKLNKIFYVNNLPKNQFNFEISNSVGKGILQINNIIKKIKPTGAVILGDRYEMLSCAISSFFLRIPIFHINGGEITHGSLDDNIRNSISHFSDYHFAPTKKSALRLKKILIDKKKIFNSGSIGASNAKNVIFNKKNYFKKKYNIKFQKKNILITVHPEKNFDIELNQVKNFLNILKDFKNVYKIFTSSNSDAHGIGINNLIERYIQKDKNSILIKSFGKDDYLSIMNHINCVVGNSSSGIIEAPVLKKPTLNIGKRQLGREMASSIINSSFDKSEMSIKLDKILNKEIKKKIYSPYYKKNTINFISNKIIKNLNEKI